MEDGNKLMRDEDVLFVEEIFFGCLDSCDKNDER